MQSQLTIMRGRIHMFIFIVGVLGIEQDVEMLSELPFGELLARKKILKDGNVTLPDAPLALGLISEPRDGYKERYRQPSRKTFHDYDEEDEKGHSKKKKHKGHDLLNTSITALSYLAFGGYLLCMIANAIREKRRRVMMTYPTGGPATNNQFASVIQNLGHRPHRPFVRFPTVTVHQGKKRRRRSAPSFANGHN